MLQTHYREPIDWTSNRCGLAQFELSDWAHELQGYWNFPLEDVHVDADVVDALRDDLNTPLAITALRSLYKEAKTGPIDTKLKFAKATKLLGFKNLGEPGYFQHGVSGTNAGKGALFEAFETVVALRAAYANSAPESTIVELSKFFEGKSYGFEKRRGGYVELVGTDYLLTEKIKVLISARNEARATKNWTEGDRIRDQLAAMGVSFKDVKDPATGELKTEWEMKR